MAARLIFLNKPYGVLTQFTDEQGRSTLKDHIAVPGVYPAGRLDADSEGLVVLTNTGNWQAYIADPRHKMAKTYWVQVENIPDEAALAALRRGVDLGDFVSQPCEVRLIAEPANLWPRTPPVRFRAAIPTCWLELKIREGKNRQVRRMTAKVGYPTLRLIRWAVSDWTLADLAPGAWREATEAEKTALPAPASQPSGRIGAPTPSRTSTSNVPRGKNARPSSLSKPANVKKGFGQKRG